MERVNKELKEKIMSMINKAGSEQYETSWNEKGLPVSKKKSEIKKGKKSRSAGLRFETKVRTDLENMGWIVDKWTNTVDFDKSQILKITPAKRKYNPFKKVLVIGTGFPDFIAFKKTAELYEVIGIEVKINGHLKKSEKSMCEWLLENKVFSKILIAKKAKKKGEVEYINFQEKYKKS